jgi:hypothetical protein
MSFHCQSLCRFKGTNSNRDGVVFKKKTKLATNHLVLDGENPFEGDSGRHLITDPHLVKQK